MFRTSPGPRHGLELSAHLLQEAEEMRRLHKRHLMGEEKPHLRLNVVQSVSTLLEKWKSFSPTLRLSPGDAAASTELTQ